MIIKLSCNGSTEEITIAILKVLNKVDSANAKSIVDYIDHDKHDKQRIKSMVYTLAKKVNPVLKKIPETYPQEFEITKAGKDYLNGKRDWQQGVPSTIKNSDDEQDTPYIPNYVYGLMKDYNISPQEALFYLWGRSQKDSAFKFTDQGAATMLNSNINTIRNWKKDLKDKGLLSCSEQERHCGKFGISQWIFHRRPQHKTPPIMNDKVDDDILPF